MSQIVIRNSTIHLAGQCRYIAGRTAERSPDEPCARCPYHPQSLSKSTCAKPPAR